MKVQEVIMKVIAGKLRWIDAAEILGITDRTMRRWRERLEQHGYDGLYDYRKRQPSPKRLPIATLEKVLKLYQETYFDLNIRHFHEKLVEVEELDVSYTWVRMAASSRPGGQTTQAGTAPQTETSAQAAWNAIAHRWWPASLVSGRAALRLDHGDG